jgi:hypothetical protein
MFSLLFLLDDRRIRIRIQTRTGTLPLTLLLSGPKNIRIHNTSYHLNIATPYPYLVTPHPYITTPHTCLLLCMVFTLLPLFRLF